MSGAKIDPARKKEALQAIALHLKRHGPTNWSLTQDHYPDINTRTFERWIATVRARAGLAGEDGPTKKVDGNARAAASAAMGDAAREAAMLVDRSLPAPVPPSYIASEGARGLKQLDFLVEIGRVFDDIEWLRDDAMRDAREGEKGAVRAGKVLTNRVQFSQTIRQRVEAMETVMKIRAEVWDLQHMQTIYEKIVAIILDGLADHPELQLKIAKELEELNNQIGMTIFGNWS